MTRKFYIFILTATIFFLNLNGAGATPKMTLIRQDDMVYEGAFRVPKGNLGGDSTLANSLSYGGSALAYNSETNSLYLIGNSREKLVIEISIPEVLNRADIDQLNTANVLQPPTDVSNSNWDNLKSDGTAIANGGSPGGLLIYKEKLIGSAYGYYDGASEAVRSHFTASSIRPLSGAKFQGMLRVGLNPIDENSANGGFVGGYMTHIPPEWQSSLGGPALTGMGAIAVITRSSLGPCAWVFNPDDLGINDPAPATMLVGYPHLHPTLGTYGDEPSLYYNRATEIRGIIFPENTGSVLFFGRHGIGSTGEGDSCYGSGTSDASLEGQLDPHGNIYCYDPTNSDKGVHAYPYVYRVWAYDANDLVSVKNGDFEPWDIKPYNIWNLDFPFAIENAHISGATYDPSSQRVFISQSRGDKPEYEPFPLIHVYKLKFPPPPPTGLSIEN
jgi:hypothetical protein